MRIKVCGMREGDNILAVEALGVDLMGFIFYKRSSRFVEEIPSHLPSLAVGRVGVFVDASLDEMLLEVDRFGLEYIQLHGSESVELCGSLKSYGVKLIKAFSVDEKFDFGVTGPYESLCDLFIFDTKCSGYGGSGESFDWGMLAAYGGSTPFLLSGGIAMESLEELQRFSHPQVVGYDLNSRFEEAPALKDVELLKNFLEQLNR